MADVVWLKPETYQGLINASDKMHQSAGQTPGAVGDSVIDSRSSQTVIRVSNTTDRTLPPRSIVAVRNALTEGGNALLHWFEGAEPTPNDFQQICVTLSEAAPGQAVQAVIEGVVVARVYSDRYGKLYTQGIGLANVARLAFGEYDDPTFAFSIENGPPVGALDGISADRWIDNRDPDAQRYFYLAKVRLNTFSQWANTNGLSVYAVRIQNRSNIGRQRYLYGVEPVMSNAAATFVAAPELPAGTMINGQETGSESQNVWPLEIGSVAIAHQSTLVSGLYVCSILKAEHGYASA